MPVTISDQTDSSSCTHDRARCDALAVRRAEHERARLEHAREQTAPLVAARAPDLAGDWRSPLRERWRAHCAARAAYAGGQR